MAHNVSVDVCRCHLHWVPFLFSAPFLHIELGAILFSTIATKIGLLFFFLRHLYTYH